MPQLHDRLTEIARIEHERILSRQATPTIAPNFSPKCAAFERMDAFVCAHELEPQKRREGRRWPTKAARCGTVQDRADMLRSVEGLPSRAIGTLPFSIRHFGMMRHAMIEVVLVHIGVHPDPLLPESLVVL